MLKMTKEIPLFSFLTVMTVLFMHIFCPRGRMDFPWIIYSCKREKVVHSLRRISLAKSCLSELLRGNNIRELSSDFSTFFKVSQRLYLEIPL